MQKRTRSAMALVIAAMISSSVCFLARAQNTGTHFEIGVVYFANQGDYKALNRDVAQESGRSNFSAKVKGSHATIRLTGNQPQIFLVCNVDPSRFKLYTFKSERNARSVTLAKINLWIGGAKTVLSESEIPVAIKAQEGGCFTLTPQKDLGDGEFGFSPDGSTDSFMFGVGDIKQTQ